MPDKCSILKVDPSGRLDSQEVCIIQETSVAKEQITRWLGIHEPYPLHEGCTVKVCGSSELRSLKARIVEEDRLFESCASKESCLIEHCMLMEACVPEVGEIREDCMSKIDMARERSSFRVSDGGWHVKLDEVTRVRWVDSLYCSKTEQLIEQVRANLRIAEVQRALLASK